MRNVVKLSKKKRSSALFMALLMFITGVCNVEYGNNVLSKAMAAGNITVKVDSSSGSPGDEVEIPVMLENNTGFCNLGIEVGYDNENLTLKEVKNNKSVGCNYTPAQKITENPYNMDWSAPDNIEYNGELVTMVFEISEDAQPGDYDINVSYYKGRFGNYRDGIDVNYDVDELPLNLSYVSGKITVEGGRSEETPTPEPEKTPTPAPEKTPTPAPEKTSTPALEKTATPVPEKTATPKPEITPSVPADGSEINCGCSDDVYREDTVSVPIYVKSDRTVSNISIEITYDRKIFELVDVYDCSDSVSDDSDFVMTTSSRYDTYPYYIEWNSYRGQVLKETDEVIMGSLEFLVKKDAPSGEYEIGISYYKGKDGNNVDGIDVNYDIDGESLEFNYISKIVNVCDNYVNISNSYAGAGEEVEVTLWAYSGKPVKNASFEITYDRSAMELIGIECNDDDSIFTTAPSYSTYPYYVKWNYPDDKDWNRLLNIYLIFRIKDDAESGEYKIETSYYKGTSGNNIDGQNVNYGFDGEPLNYKYGSGVVKVDGGGYVPSKPTLTPQPTPIHGVDATPVPTATGNPVDKATPKPTYNPVDAVTPKPTHKPNDFVPGVSASPAPAQVASAAPVNPVSNPVQSTVVNPTAEPNIVLPVTGLNHKLKLTKLSKNGKGKVKVFWQWSFVSSELDSIAEEILCTTGYQVQYALKKNFSGKKTKTVAASNRKYDYTVTIKKLKSRKNYYFRVRQYGYINGTKVYGKWSSVKKIKVK